jgi:hypothetical protein
MNISIDLTGFEDALKALNTNFDDISKQIVSRISNEMEITAKENIDERIYSQAPSPRYIRTGKAKKGIVKFNKGTQGQVVADSRKAGASKNYTPFLNKNSKIKKLNTLFWDDAVKTTKKNAGKIAQEIIKKHLKK